MDTPQIISRIKKAIAEAGTQKALAKKWHISQQYLSDVLAGRRDPGESILKNLGLEKKVEYAKRENLND
jgi:hypothetical protein